MTDFAASPTLESSPRPERSPGVKLAIAVLIAVALMVPLLMVYGLVWDRQQQAETAQTAIGEGWGGSQTIAAAPIPISLSTKYRRDSNIFSKNSTLPWTCVARVIMQLI